MDCKTAKDIIIEYNGKPETAKLKPEILSAFNSHMASCKACSLSKERMCELTSKIMADKIEMPANIAANIINKVIPKPVDVKIKTFTHPEPGFIEKIAAVFGLTSRNLSLAFSVIVLSLFTAAAFIHYNSSKEITDKEQLSVKSQPQNNEIAGKAPVENKFKKNEEKFIAQPNDPHEKKFKKDIFTIESGELANCSNNECKTDFLYEVKNGSELRISYKNAAEIIIKENSKFKINDKGMFLECGLVNVDLKPKTLEGFSVLTPESHVEVVGTMFSVSRYSEKTEVSVKKGTVRVTEIESKDSKLLNAGNSISVSKTIKKVNSSDEKKENHETSSVALSHAQSSSSTSEAIINHTVEVKIEPTNIKGVINTFKNNDITVDK